MYGLNYVAKIKAKLICVYEIHLGTLAHGVFQTETTTTRLYPFNLYHDIQRRMVSGEALYMYHFLASVR